MLNMVSFAFWVVTQEVYMYCPWPGLSNSLQHFHMACFHLLFFKPGDFCWIIICLKNFVSFSSWATSEYHTIWLWRHWIFSPSKAPIASSANVSDKHQQTFCREMFHMDYPDVNKRVSFIILWIFICLVLLLI